MAPKHPINSHNAVLKASTYIANVQKHGHKIMVYSISSCAMTIRTSSDDISDATEYLGVMVTFRSGSEMLGAWAV